MDLKKEAHVDVPQLDIEVDLASAQSFGLAPGDIRRTTSFLIQGEEAAMREVDHAGQIENERQAERHQAVEGADDQPVERVVENELRHAFCTC